MARRKGELSNSELDRKWPHQVALAAEQVNGRNYPVLHAFCRELSVAPRGHSVNRDSIPYVVFCFADPAHADAFKKRFGGEPFDPKDRGRGSHWFEWRKS